jgi:hypothetical protein
MWSSIAKYFGSFIFGVIVALAGGVSISPTDDAIDRPTARDFLEMYWNTAVSDPRSGWTYLTADFQKRQHNSNYEEYREYFDQYSGIDIESVVEYSGVPNRFTIKVTYHKDEKKDTHDDLAITLGCDSWKNHVNFVTCDSDQLQILDVIYIGKTQVSTDSGTH